MTKLNQLKRPVKMSKWEAMMTKNHGKQRFARQECIRIIPRVEKNKNTKIQDMLCTEIGVLLVSKVEEVGGQHRIELLDEEERERSTPIDACDYGFMTPENADTFPNLMCRDSRYGQTGATCCERKGPTAHSISFLVSFIKDLGFRRIILSCAVNRARNHIMVQ